eukprot:3116774-Rhodomonas_salina.1
MKSTKTTDQSIAFRKTSSSTTVKQYEYCSNQDTGTTENTAFYSCSSTGSTSSTSSRFAGTSVQRKYTVTVSKIQRPEIENPVRRRDTAFGAIRPRWQRQPELNST